MTSQNGSKRFSAIIGREWVVVVVAMVIGAVLAYVMLGRAVSDVQYQAQVRMVVPGTASSIANLPDPVKMIKLAASPSVIKSAEATMGLEPGSLSGRVTVIEDPDDMRAVLVTVDADDADTALKGAQGMKWAMEDRALLPLRQYLITQAQNEREMQARAKALVARLARLEKQAAAASAVAAPTYEQGITATQNLLFSVQDQARLARQNATTVYKSFYFDEPTTSDSDQGGVKWAVVLQGLLLGLFAGVVVAAIRELLIARREDR